MIGKYWMDFFTNTFDLDPGDYQDGVLIEVSSSSMAQVTTDIQCINRIWVCPETLPVPLHITPPPLPYKRGLKTIPNPTYI